MAGRVLQRIDVDGIVQGVGFRPFVYRLACELGIGGNVCNTPSGVTITAAGDKDSLASFVMRLERDAPPMALVERVRTGPVSEAQEIPEAFKISPSVQDGAKSTLISPDTTVCEDCLREMFDPADRRYRYPFINCTNCGPRYTIIRELPYDRSNTTMSGFTMCPECRSEYSDPDNRRYHAQPNACPVCGPRIDLLDRVGNPAAADSDLITVAAEYILDGAILAIKGLGGYHLACRADSEEAVDKLRKRKRRQDKPFALMVASVERAAEIVRLDSESDKLLTISAHPIVVLAHKEGNSIAPSVAPGQSGLGIMLPYTPLHCLILDSLGGVPLVMTSANYSDEPIEIDNRSALENLKEVVDWFLVHDRPIHTRADDSVIRSNGARRVFIRRSRGFAPRPVNLPLESGSGVEVLAVGPHLKNTICVTRGAQAFVSQHVGDIETAETLDYFRHTVKQMKAILGVYPQLVVHDFHPDYHTTRWARTESGLETMAVQHHHAHAAACMAENGLRGKVLGVVLDGTGYGTDSTIWGGEFLLADETDYARVGHLPPLVLPGGEQAILEPWRVARAALLEHVGSAELAESGKEIFAEIEIEKMSSLDRIIERRINCPLSSGCGRYFDAVSALLGVRKFALYEGQPAIELETLALEALDRGIGPREYQCGVGFEDETEMTVPELKSMWRGIYSDVLGGVDRRAIALGFHYCIASLVAAMAENLCIKYKLGRVVLSGGVFANLILLERVLELLSGGGLDIFTHHDFPPGDGSISLGQAYIAKSRLEAGGKR